jgi:hypothetical protein
MFIGKLNCFSMCACEIGSAYLLSKTCVKIAGPDFGDFAGHTVIIIKALYCLKSSGACYRDYWADQMHEQGWFSSKCDPNVWMRDKGDHYEYLAVWAYDLLYVSKVTNGFFGLLKDNGEWCWSSYVSSWGRFYPCN